jgi:hypothetical protein
MANDPAFDWTVLVAGDAGIELRINELLARILGGLVSVISADTTAEPASPDEFDAYYIPTSPTGTDWSGHDNEFGVFVGGGWFFFAPVSGHRVWIVDKGLLAVFKNTIPIAIDGHNIESGTTVTPNLGEGQSLSLTLSGTTTMNSVQSQDTGKLMTFILTQDGTGNRTVNWNVSTYRFVGGSAPTLSTASGRVDIIRFISFGGKMYEVSRALDVR